MKTLKHFLGWLFGYCPYGGTCTPKKPFKKQEDKQDALRSWQTSWKNECDECGAPTYYGHKDRCSKKINIDSGFGHGGSGAAGGGC